MEAHMVSLPFSIIFLKICLIQGTVIALLLIYRRMRNSSNMLRKVTRFTKRVKQYVTCTVGREDKVLGVSQ